MFNIPWLSVSRICCLHHSAYLILMFDLEKISFNEIINFWNVKLITIISVIIFCFTYRVKNFLRLHLELSLKILLILLNIEWCMYLENRILRKNSMFILWINMEHLKFYVSNFIFSSNKIYNCLLNSHKRYILQIYIQSPIWQLLFSIKHQSVENFMK